MPDPVDISTKKYAVRHWVSLSHHTDDMRIPPKRSLPMPFAGSAQLSWSIR
jgi:hypothetical protein